MREGAGGRGALRGTLTQTEAGAVAHSEKSLRKRAGAVLAGTPLGPRLAGAAAVKNLPSFAFLPALTSSLPTRRVCARVVLSGYS